MLQNSQVFRDWNTPRKFSSSPLKIGRIPKGKYIVFQLSFFRGYDKKIRGCMHFCRTFIWNFGFLAEVPILRNMWRFSYTHGHGKDKGMNSIDNTLENTCFIDFPGN